MSSNIFLPYGLREGKLLHISSVERGLACCCNCPACHGPLVAKKGTSKQHHFAHAQDADCTASVETALHLAAKTILAEKREIFLPSVQVMLWSNAQSPILAPEQRYEIGRVEIEKRIDSIVPDVIAYISGRAVAIEIRVTHAVDEKKASLFESIGLSAIEIDLSNAPRTFSVPELESLVIGPGPHKAWLFNAAAMRYRQRILSIGKVMRSVHRGFAVHVDGCPIRARVWNGKSYANVVDDCFGCEFALEIASNMETVLCNAVSPAEQ